MENKVAIIDLGTNTFHLLLAEADGYGYHITHRERLAVKIGKDGINKGIITQEGVHRALVAMQSFKNVIDSHGIQKIYAVGTSALRNAHNGQEVVQQIKSLTGITVNIISGDEEAVYIYHGVRSAVGMGTDKCLIIDIGGGSVEFIIGDHDRIYWKESLETGAQRLLEKFHTHDPITADEIRLLDEHFGKTLTSLFTALRKYPAHVLVGSSGTFDTLSDIFCTRHGIHKSAEEIETPLSVEGFYELYHELIHKDRKARMAMPGMIEMRVDMIVVASCLIRYILEKHPFNRIRVSTYSLKEGVFATLIQQLKVAAH